MKKQIAALGVLCTVGACADPDDGSEAGDMEEMIDQRVEVGEPEEGILRLTLPEIVIPAGEERQMCWVTDYVATEETLISTMTTYQGSMGHHLSLFASTVPRQPGDVFDCTQLESMTNLRPAVLPDTTIRGEETSYPFTLPENFVVKVPVGVALVMQAHYVNVGDKDAITQDVADLKIVGRGPETIEASYFILNDDLVDIPVGRHSRSMWCEAEEDMDFVVMFGHMHDWGESIQIEHEMGESKEMVWSVEQWRPDYRDAPPITVFDPETPLSITTGDKLRVTCNYNNTEDKPLRFPTEMCTGIGMYYPAVTNDENGVIICDSKHD